VGSVVFGWNRKSLTKAKKSSDSALSLCGELAKDAKDFADSLADKANTGKDDMGTGSRKERAGGPVHARLRDPPDSPPRRLPDAEGDEPRHMVRSHT
jgi:hypothetical protein